MALSKTILKKQVGETPLERDDRLVTQSAYIDANLVGTFGRQSVISKLLNMYNGHAHCAVGHDI